MKRIIRTKIYFLLSIGFLSLITTGCDPVETQKKLPTLSTDTISAVTQNTAVCGGNITSDNGLEVTARGVCWSLKPNPTTKDSISKDAAGTGKFKSQLTNLLPDTVYYVRAYATNNDGTAYGLQVTFRTLKTIFPVLTTTKSTEISDISATSGGNVSFNGGTVVSGRGVCWSTNPLPTILDNKTTNGNGNGIFTSSITGLTAGTTYYIRAYATNNAGTGYGNQDTIKTLTIPTLTTISAVATSATTASSGGNISNDGGTPVTNRGVCWSTTSTPTINDTKTNDGNGTGNFTSTLSSLTANVTYYIRAYATNKIGTAYGNVVTVKTSNFPTNGLIAWYPFNGNANDESGNSMNGNVTGATLTNDRKNSPNSAYDFDFSGATFGNKNDEIYIPYDSKLNISNISVSTWIYPRSYYWSGNSGDKNSTIIRRFQYGYSSPKGETWGINFNATSISAFIINVSGNTQSVVYSTPIPLNSWSNIIFTYNGNVLSLFLNGNLVASKSTNIILNVSGNSGISIGESNQANGYWNYTDGKIDDIGIWNRALLQEEITNLYNQNQ